MKQHEVLLELHKGKRPVSIAIVDDHRLLRELIAQSISSLKDCEVILSVDTGEELLEGLMGMKKCPDVCIIDINMPGLNGYDTQKAVKSRWPDIKTLALSLYDERKCIKQMLQNGANGFVSKQSSLDGFYEAILSVYHHGSYLSDEAIRELHDPDSLPVLTEREKEYLTLLCAQLSNHEIALKMGVNIKTIDHYRESVYKKVQVNSKADLLFYVKNTGIVYMK